MNVRSGKEQSVDSQYKYVVAKDLTGKWFVAELLLRTSAYAKIHFLGWNSRYDEEISQSDYAERVKPIQKGGKYWCWRREDYHKTKEELVADVQSFISKSKNRRGCSDSFNLS
jgi:hypothetical protein